MQKIVQNQADENVTKLEVEASVVVGFVLDEVIEAATNIQAKPARLFAQ